VVVSTQNDENIIAKRRRIITIVIAALAAVISGIAFVLMYMRVPNMHIISYLVLGFSTLLVTLLVLWTLGARQRYSRLASVLRRCYMTCLAVGLAGFLVLQGFIVSGARTEVAEVDCVIVLGAGLYNDAPSLVLRRRLNAAADYLKTREHIPVIVAGGLGRGERITEAEAMSNYLISRGVDENRIWKEDESTRTQESLAFSLALMEEKGLDVDNIKVAVVSNEFHLYRAKLIAGKAGMDAIGIAAETPGTYLRTLYYCREAFALAAEVIFG